MSRTATSASTPRGLSHLLLHSPLAFVVIAILAAAVYWKVPTYSIDKFDEQEILQGNLDYLVRSATIADIVQRDAFLRRPGKSFYRPVQNLSYLLDARIGHGKVSAFYVSSILLHIAASCLVLALLRLMVGHQGVSLALALLFTVNPLFVQVIAWTPGRGDLLMAVFSLGAVLALHRSMQGGSRLWLAACVLASLLAMLSKETALVLTVLLPASVLLRSETRSSRTELLVATAGAIASAAAAIWLRTAVLNSPSASEFGVANLIGNLRTLPEMSAKFLLPTLLQPMAGFTVAATAIGGLILTALLSYSVLKGNTRDRLLTLVGLAWFTVFLLPGMLYTHRFGSAAYDYLEHRGYVPAFGLLLMLSVPARLFFARFASGKIAPVLAAVIMLFGALSMRHSAKFATADLFYDQAITANPASALALANRGQNRLYGGNLQGAILDFQAALSIKPDFIMAHFGLGVLGLQQNDFASAIKHLRIARSIEPSALRLTQLLGNAYTGTGDLDSAMACYGIVYAADPTDHESAINLGVITARNGNWPMAHTYFAEAARRAPSLPMTWLNLGIAAQNLGRIDEACSHWERAERLGDAQSQKLRAENCGVQP